jgi:predicted aminopeptidase
VSRRARVALAAAALGAALFASGCSTLGYYAQSVGGHLDILRRARPVAEVRADPSTPHDLRERLQLALRLREFAAGELKLPDNSSYRRYAALDRPAAVWNVVAAPEFSLKLKTWCFPVMGCVGYRGYFKLQDANALADELRAQGYEVSVYGVPAYSTLGWTNWLGGDPILSTFVRWPEAELARLIFHELAHQIAYARDDTTFNESFATAVERLGGARWQQVTGRTLDQSVARRRDDFRALARRIRAELEALYESALPVDEKRSRKAALFAELRAGHAQLKAGPWAGFTGYDAWFAGANNASLAVQAAYDSLVPEFERLFEREGRDYERFYDEVKRLAALPRDERRATLQAQN